MNTFQFELTSCEQKAEQLLRDYPIRRNFNKNAENSVLEAIETVLANIVNGEELIIPNIARCTIHKVGFSRESFKIALQHLRDSSLLDWHGKGNVESRLRYFLDDLVKYQPDRTVFRPMDLVVIKGGKLAINTVRHELVQLTFKLKRYWNFLQDFNIQSGISNNMFQVFDYIEKEVEKKDSLRFPDEKRILPYMVFNDVELKSGGRMYGAFWIDMKKELRRGLTINGEKTVDIDGKGMHIQLLYKLHKEHMPYHDPYIFQDSKKRLIAKKLMILMINTKTEYTNLEEARGAVIRTYNYHNEKVDRKILYEMIETLEKKHKAIKASFYKSNWGYLQKQEAAVMMSIMEHGIKDNILVLPVHDGCLCQKQHKDKVLGYFTLEGIIADENKEHLKPLRYREAVNLHNAHKEYQEAA